MAKTSLYRRLLGDRLDELPVTLRHFHDKPDGGEAVGVCQVTRGQGRIRGFLADLAGFPPSGADVKLHLMVIEQLGCERWIRTFNEHRLETRQSFHKGLLIEGAGPLRLGFEVAVETPRLLFQLKRAWLWVIPIPLFLAPRASAIAIGEQSGWRVNVELGVPIFGCLVRYAGSLQPTSSH